MNKVITITRQYGSGGREIGRKLAEAYDIPFYDNEIIARAAKETGFAEAAFERAEDKATNSLLYSIAMGMNVFSNQDAGMSALSLDDRIFLAQSNVIRKVAEEGPCVIVGRCADYILKDRSDVINLFIGASVDSRIQRSIEIDMLPENRAAEIVLKKDKSRGNYYKYHSGERWDNVFNYDMALRSDRCGIDGTVECIRAYLDRM
ncbi:MAG: cytidylate kinase-like family protein [Lachnospiraceae bacterium]|nr:cytidylate kinase-like family protein [Lachnospiraceae bacterium]